MELVQLVLVWPDVFPKKIDRNVGFQELVVQNVMVWNENYSVSVASVIRELFLHMF